jgi:hypothetical protein
MMGDCRDRDARPTLLLAAVQARRLSTQSSLSKAVPCNIIVSAAGMAAMDYLKPKVFSVEPSTIVTAPPEKNVVAYNSVKARQFVDHNPRETGLRTGPWIGPSRRGGALI